MPLTCREGLATISKLPQDVLGRFGPLICLYVDENFSCLVLCQIVSRTVICVTVLNGTDDGARHRSLEDCN